MYLIGFSTSIPKFGFKVEIVPFELSTCASSEPVSNLQIVDEQGLAKSNGVMCMNRSVIAAVAICMYIISK